MTNYRNATTPDALTDVRQRIGRLVAEYAQMGARVDEIHAARMVRDIFASLIADDAINGTSQPDRHFVARYAAAMLILAGDEPA